MALPPLLAGAAQLTVAEALPAVATTPVGAPGTVITTGATGVTLLEATDAAPAPALLLAVTVNVYAVPLLRPGTGALVADAGTLTDAIAGSDALTV
jgi:hypothetical protein